MRANRKVCDVPVTYVKVPIPNTQLAIIDFICRTRHISRSSLLMYMVDFCVGVIQLQMHSAGFYGVLNFLTNFVPKKYEKRNDCEDSEGC